MLTRLRNFFQHSWASLKQYPGAYLTALALAVIAVITNHSGYNGDWFDNVDSLVLIIFGLLVTLPLMVVGPLMREINPSLSKRYALLGQLMALGLGVLFYFFVLPETKIDMATGSQSLQIAFSLIIAWILPLGAIVIATKGERELLRGRCKQFIIALVVAGLSAMILWGGISASIASIEYLFDVTIQSAIYMDIGIIARAIVGVMICLTRLQTNADERMYNKIFRFFGLYIFTPLTLIYTLILVAYAVKIIVLREWPQSGTVWLVGAFVAFSMVGYLLIYPLISQLSRLRKAQTVYCVSLIAFSTFLIIAFFKRLEYHGFTVEEYYIALLAVRMISLSLLTLRDRQRSLSGIVLFFIVLLLLSLYGPQSATSLSTRMQSNYLMSMLAKNNFLTDDNYIMSRERASQTGDVSTGDLKKIHTVAKYLAQAEGVDFFKPLYMGTGFDQLSGANRWDAADIFMTSIGVDYGLVFQPYGSYDDLSRSFNFYANDLVNPIDIRGYNFIVRLDSPLSIKVNNSDKKDSIQISVANKTYVIDIIKYLQTVDTQILSTSTEQKSPLTFLGDDYMLILTSVTGMRGDDDAIDSVSYYQGYVLVK